MGEVLTQVLRMLPFLLLPLPVAIAARFCRVHSLRRRGWDTTGPHELGFLLLVAWICGLLAVTVMPVFRISDGRLLAEWGTGGGILMEPFRIFRDSWEQWQRGNPSYGVINLLGNIFIFCPIGLLPSLLWRGAGWKRAAAYGLGFSLFIEVTQLFLPGRWTDVDDLWMNTLGALLGYGLYRLIPQIYTERFLLKKPEK